MKIKELCHFLHRVRVCEGGGGRIRPPNGPLTASGFQPPEGPMQLEAQVDSSHQSPVQSLGTAHSETSNVPVHGCCPSLTTKYPCSHQGDDEQIKELPGLSAARFQFVVACRQGLREAPRVCRSVSCLFVYCNENQTISEIQMMQNTTAHQSDQLKYCISCDACQFCI